MLPNDSANNNVTYLIDGHSSNNIVIKSLESEDNLGLINLGSNKQYLKMSLSPSYKISKVKFINIKDLVIENLQGMFISSTLNIGHNVKKFTSTILGNIAIKDGQNVLSFQGLVGSNNTLALTITKTTTLSSMYSFDTDDISQLINKHSIEYNSYFQYFCSSINNMRCEFYLYQNDILLFKGKIGAYEAFMNINGSSSILDIFDDEKNLKAKIITHFSSEDIKLDQGYYLNQIFDRIQNPGTTDYANQIVVHPHHKPSQSSNVDYLGSAGRVLEFSSKDKPSIYHILKQGYEEVTINNIIYQIRNNDIFAIGGLDNKISGDDILQIGPKTRHHNEFAKLYFPNSSIIDVEFSTKSADQIKINNILLENIPHSTKILIQNTTISFAMLSDSIMPAVRNKRDLESERDETVPSDALSIEKDGVQLTVYTDTNYPLTSSASGKQKGMLHSVQDGFIAVISSVSRYFDTTSNDKKFQTAFIEIINDDKMSEETSIETEEEMINDVDQKPIYSKESQDNDKQKTTSFYGMSNEQNNSSKTHHTQIWPSSADAAINSASSHNYDTTIALYKTYQLSIEGDAVLLTTSDGDLKQISTLASSAIFPQIDGSFILQSFYKGCDRSNIRNKYDLSQNDQEVHMIIRGSDGFNCLDLYHIRQINNINNLPLWARSCKKPTSFQEILSIPKFKTLGALDKIKEDIGLTAQFINVYNTIDTSLNFKSPYAVKVATNISVAVAAISVTSFVSVPTIPFLSLIPSSKYYIDLIKNYLPENMQYKDLIAISCVITMIASTSYIPLLEHTLSAYTIFKQIQSTIPSLANSDYKEFMLMTPVMLSAAIPDVQYNSLKITSQFALGIKNLQFLSAIYSICNIIGESKSTVYSTYDIVKSYSSKCYNYCSNFFSQKFTQEFDPGLLGEEANVF